VLVLNSFSFLDYANIDFTIVYIIAYVCCNIPINIAGLVSKYTHHPLLRH